MNQINLKFILDVIAHLCDGLGTGRGGGGGRGRGGEVRWDEHK